MTTVKQALESAIDALNDALTRFDTFNEKQIDAIQTCHDALADSEKEIAELKADNKRLREALFSIRDSKDGLYGENLLCCNEALTQSLDKV